MRNFIITIAVAIVTILSCTDKSSYPDLIQINGGKLHVQGLAFDHKEQCLYCSFTSEFYKTDLEGNIIGSIVGINGHLGAMTFDENTRKVYASLELKDDEIGSHISETLGVEAYSRQESNFYVAEIDVNKITGLNIAFEDAVTLHQIKEAGNDYNAKVVVDGIELEHKYGCSGIDGVTLAPAFGKNVGGKKYLYVAYGIYGDNERQDNDYNIILCYDLKDLSKLLKKYFIFTGNTRYGIQNLAYDDYTDKMFLAVYKGNKPQYPNYSLFALDMSQEPFLEELKGVPYQDEAVLQLKFSSAWHFKYGSTGLCPLGDGYYYISEKAKENGQQICKAKLYLYSENEETPFIRPKTDNNDTATF